MMMSFDPATHGVTGNLIINELYSRIYLNIVVIL